ncbi:hypothetical protein HPP92_002440 [Vanilla planifolia]|uniref:Uncharacterized protein n=1 Tax=Vanilla planifolia TaxID=51239 RepID=A0A835RTN4_VANPL|nr:hypothetical protein HPP92_002802 [Vanilla planifolia]KAG0502368.1 hypothetical protein HPP92_002440 [Vanilla planifolia]
MLFAVEGGGFFSSSATGYSKGLAVLLLGQRNEEKPMKVSPWNQYQLVEQERIPGFQLASRKSSTSRRCASYICFGRTSAGNDGSCPPKVGPVLQAEATLTSDDNDISTSSKNENSSKKKVCLKSSLKRPREDHTGVSSIACESSEVVSISRANDRRKVQWTDACGRELIQIREFECSDADASDDEHENGGHNKCLCVIQ